MIRQESGMKNQDDGAYEGMVDQTGQFRFSDNQLPLLSRPLFLCLGPSSAHHRRAPVNKDNVQIKNMKYKREIKEQQLSSLHPCAISTIKIAMRLVGHTSQLFFIWPLGYIKINPQSMFVYCILYFSPRPCFARHQKIPTRDPPTMAASMELGGTSMGRPC
jgi:hypothetical protein